MFLEFPISRRLLFSLMRILLQNNQLLQNHFRNITNNRVRKGFQSSSNNTEGH